MDVYALWLASLVAVGSVMGSEKEGMGRRLFRPCRQRKEHM